MVLELLFLSSLCICIDTANAADNTGTSSELLPPPQLYASSLLDVLINNSLPTHGSSLRAAMAMAAGGMAGTTWNLGKNRFLEHMKKVPQNGLEAYTMLVLSKILDGKMKVFEHVKDLSTLQQITQQVFQQADLASVKGAISEGAKWAVRRYVKTKFGIELSPEVDVVVELAGKVAMDELEQLVIYGPKAIQKLGSHLFVRISLPDGKAAFERLKVSEWKQFVETRRHGIQTGNVELYVQKPAQEVMQRSAAVAHKVYAQISNKETKEFLESKVHQFQEVVKQAYAVVPDSVKKNVANVFGKIHGIANSAYNRMPAVPEPVRHTAGELYNKAANILHKHLAHAETSHTATEAEGDINTVP